MISRKEFIIEFGSFNTVLNKNIDLIYKFKHFLKAKH